MDISLIQSAITSLNTVSNIAKSFLELKSISDVQGKVIELQSAILSAQSSALSANADQTAMVEEIRSLKEEIAHIKAWEKEKKRYKLVEPWKNNENWNPGSLAYALKESMKKSEPPHLICTKCYEDERKSILNPFKPTDGRVVFTCPVCKLQIPTGNRWTVPPVKYAPD
jgi:hypothetical protein